MYVTDQLREKFLKFFSQRQHKVFPSDSLVPKNDPTLLFTSAGMNQFKDYFLGKIKDTKRATSCQRCLRTGDLERVGKTDYHHTFFEMLGNFSFGDYFKKEAISWAWEFLTQELKLDKERLWASVYLDDDEAYEIWQKDIGLKREKIVRLGPEDNFWPANAPEDGPDGPCGPCSEIFFDWGKDRGCGRGDCSPAHSCGRFTEIWNLVFTQFNRQGKNNLLPLPMKNIDTGMGLERLSAVVQGKFSNFDIDSFHLLKEEVKKYLLQTSSPSLVNAVVDHSRAIVFSIFDGIYPSNEDRGYVVRRLIRRALWFGFKSGQKSPFLYKLPPLVAESMKAFYPELEEKLEYIASVILKEEERFLETLARGKKIIFDFIKSHKGQKEKEFPGDFVFRLYDTYGFPVELTETIAQEEGFRVNKDEFLRLAEEQRARSRQASKFEESIFDLKEMQFSAATKFIGYENLLAKAEVLGVRKEEEKYLVVLDQTPFYPTSGGQLHDKGVIKSEPASFLVEEVFKNGEVIFHRGRFEKGKFSEGEKVEAEVDALRRKSLARAHTSTHLLQAALRKVLGKHIQQQGSLVDEDYLRFDFSHFKKLSSDELSEIESLVNSYIAQAKAVKKEELSLPEAKARGALAFFEEKYGERVRVVTVEGISCELCGGTHLNNTLEAQAFVIISEGSIASGIRRIEAKVGPPAQKELLAARKKLDKIKALLGLSSDAEEKIISLQKENKLIKQELYNLKKEFFQKVEAEEILKKEEKVKDVRLFLFKVEKADANFLRQALDILKRKRQNKALFLGILEDEQKTIFNLSLTPDLAGRFDCGLLAKKIGQKLGGSGGGKKNFAFGGLKKRAALEEVKKALKEIIDETD